MITPGRRAATIQSAAADGANTWKQGTIAVKQQFAMFALLSHCFPELR